MSLQIGIREGRETVELKAARPRIAHVYGDGLVCTLDITLQDVKDRYQLEQQLKDLQKGYIKVTLEKA